MVILLDASGMVGAGALREALQTPEVQSAFANPQTSPAQQDDTSTITPGSNS